MIVGHGMLASAFARRFASARDLLIFASGVSNSSTCDGLAFAREEALLKSSMDRVDSALIYFSSCGLVDGDTAGTPYMQHKRRMEALVLASKRNLVFRLPQVVGHTDNPHTLANNLRDHIISNTPFEVWEHAERNIVDVEDVAEIAWELLRSGPRMERIINIAAERSSPMLDIVSAMEQALGMKANLSLAPKGAPMILNCDIALTAAARLGLDLSEGYMERVIHKYYSRTSLLGSL